MHHSCHSSSELSCCMKPMTTSSATQGRNVVVLPQVLFRMATTVKDPEELCQETTAWKSNWTNLTFLQWVLKYMRQKVQMPIYQMGDVQLDPRILVTEEQLLQTIRRLSDGVWRDYREQCKKIAADNQVTILMAMISTSIYHTSWDEILGLASVITEMVQAEMVMNPDIGQFMFMLK